tara:strand:+ start:209 stop:1837 length:1629 start_codon:yes stop_codon:yes gene_type:complete
MKDKKVLAIKYRPVVLDDLLGQEVVSKTIFNSLKLEKIPNAFLFHGIRGTGKTSIARIIAKGLNCKNGIERLCKDNFCDNCKAISNASHLDVIEQDCATATGIDSVRDLIEFCKYPPSSAKYKVLILDEIQAMSKAGAQSLLKILEEPPNYVKFIFCTTEIKKILVTMLSRCTRFDLSRVKFQDLFVYLKKIIELENGKISDEALKLICKCSEGSVRDSLSLLDRALLIDDNVELDLKTAQKIFGHFDKSLIIELLNKIFEGNEKEVINIYQSIYSSGVDPLTFLNDFLEILYYLKNIDAIQSNGSGFDLNDSEHKNIKNLKDKIDNKTIILFWQFTIKMLDEIKVVSNQDISVEMFLIRLLYLKQFNIDKISGHDIKFDEKDTDNLGSKKINDKNLTSTVDQIKNITQTDELKLEKKNDSFNYEIKSMHDLINLCIEKKEMSLKYELETNVKLVSFSKNLIEISFNDDLNNNFIKDLTTKLFEWTSQRWIITLTKELGSPPIKQVIQSEKDKIYCNFKKTNEYQKLKNLINDIELIDIKKD